MYRNLLVHIPTERSPRPAIDGSVSLAMTCSAPLEAIAVGYESVNDVPFVAEGGVAMAPLFEAQHQQAVERARAALAVFEFEAKAAQIAYRCRPFGGTFAEAADILGATARLSDLTIVSQPELTDATNDNLMPQELLFRSGGPVLVVPYTFHGALSIDRIGILWDGGRLAARALRDAMPLISRANALTVLTVNEPVSAETSPERLLAHLASRGLPAKTLSLQADHSRIQSTILSAAADEGLDLLIMGGFGHSRLKETVLGGVTRDMFRCMTVPALMSH
ncbi:universal stress protein [Bradyrhizobium sp.]|uniref:universal stress protein n=1 Tax=Bradyrhizobium sp. TaxID=376 RepID=UPI003C628B4D